MSKGIAVSDLGGIAMAFGLVAIILGVGATILSQVQAGQVANSYAANATGYGLTGVTTLGNWLPTIAVIIAAAVVIGIIVTHFRQ